MRTLQFKYFEQKLESSAKVLLFRYYIDSASEKQAKIRRYISEPEPIPAEGHGTMNSPYVISTTSTTSATGHQLACLYRMYGFETPFHLAERTYPYTENNFLCVWRVSVNNVELCVWFDLTPTALAVCLPFKDNPDAMEKEIANNKQISDNIQNSFNNLIKENKENKKKAKAQQPENQNNESPPNTGCFAFFISFGILGYFAAEQHQPVVGIIAAITSYCFLSYCFKCLRNGHYPFCRPPFNIHTLREALALVEDGKGRIVKQGDTLIITTPSNALDPLRIEISVLKKRSPQTYAKASALLFSNDDGS